MPSSLENGNPAEEVSSTSSTNYDQLLSSAQAMRPGEQGRVSSVEEAQAIATKVDGHLEKAKTLRGYADRNRQLADMPLHDEPNSHDGYNAVTSTLRADRFDRKADRQEAAAEVLMDTGKQKPWWKRLTGR